MVNAMHPQFTDYLPGLVLLLVIGGVARLLSLAFPQVNHLIIAIGLGILLGNAAGLPNQFEQGVGSHKLLLEVGIVLMGARIALGDVLANGVVLLGLVFGIVTFGILFVEILSRRVFDVEPKLSSLIATGSSICGVSAIVAVAGGIKADEEQIAYAVATILLFDAVTIFLYPWVGNLLALPDQIYGMWAGLSMFSTGPVTAAGFAYSDVAGQWAVLTKVTRNALIGGIAVVYSLYYAQRKTGEGTAVANSHLNLLWDLWKNFPKFIVGFVLIMILASIGVLGSQDIASLKNGYQWLFLFAFAGLGLQIRLDDMRGTGFKPVAIVTLALLTISTLSLGLLLVLF